MTDLPRHRNSLRLMLIIERSDQFSYRASVRTIEPDLELIAGSGDLRQALTGLSSALEHTVKRAFDA